MIIGISGKAGAGKDVFAGIAVNEFGAERIAFADGLKEEVSAFLTECSVQFHRNNLYGSQSMKEMAFSIVNVDCVIARFPKFEEFVDKYCSRDSYFHNNITSTYRSLLQWWGTEYRRSQDINYWVNKLINYCADPEKIYVVPDTRFKNEADGVLDNGGKLVRIERNQVIEISNMNHPSEIDLDDYDKFSVTIRNNWSLSEYENLCRGVIKRIINGNI